MAEVSNLQRLNHHHSPPPRSVRPLSTGSEPQQEEGFYHQPRSLFFDYESFSPPNNPSNHSFVGDRTTTLSFGLDLNSEIESPWSKYEDPNCLFYGGEEDAEQMNFVTDLFESCGAQVTEDPIWEFDSQRADDLGLEFGFGPGPGSNGDLRVMGMGLESDSEEFEVNSGFVNNDIDDDNNESFVVNNINNNNHHSGNEREEFEWEEVSERINSDESESLNTVIDRIEEIYVSSDISSERGNSMLGDDEGDEEERTLGWEVLLAMNNLERNSEPYDLEEHINQESEIFRDDLPEDYILAMEYDALFGMLVENESALKGSPPAAKSVVENLPTVILTKEEVEETNNMVACAVCKDEVSVGEKVSRLPCCHLYHRECVLPWLKIRNTCPVCRHELPTDDADYEKRRRERGGGGVFAARVVDGVQVTHNFELLP